MKKSLLFFGAALITLAACNKEIQETPEIINQKDVVLTFTSAKPGLTDEIGTRTAWDNTTSSIIWSATDKIRVAYTMDGDWMGKDAATSDKSAKFYASDEVTIDGTDSSIGTFTVPVGDNSFTDPASSGDYVFYALYPYTAASATINDVEALAITVPSEQTPEANSFQSSADVLVGKTETLKISGIPTDPIEIDWTRLVAHADLTFSNIAFDGKETINTITLTANSAAKLTGDITIDLAAGTASEGSSNVITINGRNLVSSGSSVEAWVCVLPVTFTSLNVEIQTNKAKYTREITGISKTFKKNARNRLTINMSTAVRTEDTPDEYTEYTSALVEGDYVVYYSGYAMKAAVSSNRMQNEAVTPSGDVIATDNASIVWHIAPSATAGYYTFYNAETGKYLAATKSNNQAQLLDSGTDDKALFSVTLTDGKFDFVNKSNSRYLRQNGDNGWAMYSASTGGAVSLYCKDNRTEFPAPASVSASINGSDDTVIDVTFATVDGAASYTIIATPEAGDPVSKAGVSTSPATISVADGLAYSTEYTISVVAVPSNTATYKNSAATSATGTVTTGSAPAKPEGYEIISTLDELETGLYVVAGKTNSTYYALPSITTGKIAGVAIPVSDGFISAEDGENYALTITKDASGKVAISDGSNYLTIKTSGTDFGTSTTASYYSVSVNNGIFAISNTRYLAWRGSSYLQFGNYASITGEYSGVYLFKYNGVIKANPETTVTPASPIALTVDGTQQLTVDTNSDGAITYESDDDDIATVSNTGLITAIAAGTAHITVKIAATNSYKADEKVITVNVTNGGDGDSTPEEISGTFTYDGDAKTLTLTTESGVTIVQAQNDGTDNISSAYNTASTLRVYANHSLTFTGKTFTKIVMTYPSAANNRTGTFTANTGVYTLSSTTGTWEGEASSVVLTTSTQARPSSITVYYK